MILPTIVYMQVGSTMLAIRKTGTALFYDCLHKNEKLAASCHEPFTITKNKSNLTAQYVRFSHCAAVRRLLNHDACPLGNNSTGAVKLNCR